MLPLLELMLFSMALGLFTHQASPPRVFRLSKVAAPCCTSSANSHIRWPSALNQWDQSPPYVAGLLLKCSPIIPSALDGPSRCKMPREQPVMGCRRGSYRDRGSRQSSSTTSEPSSNTSEFYCYRYLATRSGRARGRGKTTAEVCLHHSHTHTAHFRIPCSLGNSSFIVSVFVEMCEVAVSSREVNPKASLQQRMVNQDVNQRQDSGGLHTMQINADAGPSAPARGDPSSSVARHSDSKDSDRFGCRIVEE